MPCLVLPASPQNAERTPGNWSVVNGLLNAKRVLANFPFDNARLFRRFGGADRIAISLEVLFALQHERERWANPGQ